MMMLIQQTKCLTWISHRCIDSIFVTHSHIELLNWHNIHAALEYIQTNERSLRISVLSFALVRALYEAGGEFSVSIYTFVLPFTIHSVRHDGHCYLGS